MNKVFIGTGTLQDFAQDYEKTAIANKGRMWSTCYPSGQARGNATGFNMLFEYVIGYEDFDNQNPQQQNIQLRQPVSMTQQKPMEM